jgi:methionyl-tRNA formyltransferase
MRVVFFGATDLGYHCCKAIIDNGHNVAGIFTIAQEFKISYSPNGPVKNYLFADFHSLGREYGIPVYTINGDLKDHYEQLKSLEPDLLIAIGWYYMIPDRMLALASKGGFGAHASLLPKYRGNAPLVWAMINGEVETGVSLFYFADGVDTGDIIGQEKFEIDDSDTISDLLEKTKKAAIKLLKEYLPKVANDTAPRIPQDHSQATVFPKRSPEDGLIDWSWDSKRIRNFIRAQTKPYPGAFSYINGKKVIFWDADVLEPTVDDRDS